jgi:MFS family permease
MCTFWNVKINARKKNLFEDIEAQLEIKFDHRKLKTTIDLIEITSIDIAGIKILEPVTTITDLMVTAVCVFAFYELRAHTHKEAKHVKFYRYFFLFMGLATLLGGLIGHAFLYLFSFGWKVPAWIVSMISIALAERAAIMRAKPLLHNNAAKFFTYLNVVELITFMVIAMYTLKFIFVEIHAMYGLLVVVFSFEGYIYLKTKDEGSKKILWAVLLAALAASVHIGKITIHKWFNYFDLAHVFMAISCYVLYKAVKDMTHEYRRKQKMPRATTGHS